MIFKADIFSARRPNKKILEALGGSMQNKYRPAYRGNITGNEENVLNIALSVVEYPKMSLSQRKTVLNVLAT